MPPPPPLPAPATAGVARQLYAEGLPVSEIARRTGLSRSQVYYWADRLVGADGSVSHAPLPRRGGGMRLPAGKVGAGEAEAGTAGVGEAEVGKPGVGGVDSGRAAPGEAASDRATPGKSGAGESAAGKSGAGTAAFGRPALGRAAPGRAAPGGSSVGRSGVGASEAGASGAGGSVSGRSVSGRSASGRSASGKSAPGETGVTSGTGGSDAGQPQFRTSGIGRAGAGRSGAAKPGAVRPGVGPSPSLPAVPDTRRPDTEAGSENPIRTAGAPDRPSAAPLPRRRGSPRARLLARLWQAAERQVAEIEARIAAAGLEAGSGEPRAAADTEKDARALALLARTLRELSAAEGEGTDSLKAKAASAHDTVRDLDVFRRELARRLDRLREGGPGAGPAG